jgi:predicted alpha/beta hydrolase family esterase
MTNNIFIFHGAGGNPTENWFAWLQNELTALGHQVLIPAFPTPENQSLQSWLKVMQPYASQITADTVLVGHSLGATLALILLEQYSVRAAYLVAGFMEPLDNPQFDLLNKTFITHDFQWTEIKKNCKKFELFQSSNDPYVPMQVAQHLAEKLNTNLTVVSEAGHFNSAAGYRTFQLLLEHIKSEIK